MRTVSFPIVTGLEHNLSGDDIKRLLEKVTRGEDKLVHRGRVMHLLGCQKTKCYELMNSGQLGPVFKVGASRKVLESKVTGYLAKNMVSAID
jgi:predicted DNA-binding transcriptional regulator AlpA